MEYSEKLRIYERAKRIVESNEIDWDDKYDLIFSEEISQKFNFDYYDPDTSYKEDVEAFISAFDEYMRKQKIISQF